MPELEPVFMTLRAAVGEFHTKMGEAAHDVEKLERKGSGSFSKLAAVGKGALLGIVGVAATVGIASIHLADTLEKSHAQLQNAIVNSGATMRSFKGPVAEADKAMERFGFTNAQTEEALAHLTTATNSPRKALAEIGLAANIARARNLDLATSSDIVAKVMAGNLRPLKQFGIDLPIAAGGALRLQKAQDALAKAQLALNAVQGGGAAAGARYAAGRAAVLRAEQNLQAVQTRYPGIAAQTVAGHAAILKAQEALTAAQLKAAAASTGGSSKIAHALSVVADKQKALSAIQHASGSVIDALNQRFRNAAKVFGETFAGKMAAGTATVSDLGAALGKKLIPVVIKAAEVTFALVRWLEKHKAVAIALAAVVGGIVLAAIGAYIASVVVAAATTLGLVTVAEGGALALSAAFLPVMIAIGAVIVIGFLLFRYWKQIWEGVQIAVHYAWMVIKPIGIALLVLFFWPIILAVKLLHDHWRGAWQGIQAVAHAAWSVIKPIFDIYISYLHLIWDVVVLVGRGIASAWGAIWSAIGGTVKTGVNVILQGINWVIRALDSFKFHLSIPIPGIPDINFKGLGIPEIPYLEKGGIVPGVGPILAIVHGGEEVIPRGRVGRTSAGSGTPVTLVLVTNLDGRQIARTVLPFVQSGLILEKRRSGQTGVA